MAKGLSTVLGRRTLKFASAEGLRQCVERYTNAHPDAYFGSAGNHQAIVSDEFFDELTTALEMDGVEFTEVELRSMADLSPEEQAKLRRRHGQPAPGFEDRKKVLEELRARYGGER